MESKLNSENIWKIWKKNKLKSEMYMAIMEGKKVE